MKRNLISATVEDILWAGTERSWFAYLGLVQARAERESVHITAAMYAEQAKAPPYLLEVSGAIGIIQIKGSMSNTASYWDMHDKTASYPAIREALVEAANNPAIKHILLDIDSGGGSVSGVADVGSLISAINKDVKPVSAFTDGNMMSAAYWLGSSAGKVYASKVAGVGSCGVIATHMERTKMMEEISIKITVIRTGKYKALANGYEKLTPAAEAQVQDGVDAAYTVFAEHVSERRGVTYAVADTKMCQGREFFGEQALTAGLVDGITTFDSLMTKIQTSLDNKQAISHNSRNITQGNTMKTALTEQQMAALASGVTLAATVAPAGGDDTEAVTQAAVVAQAAIDADALAVAAALATPAVVAAVAAPVVADSSTQIVAFLQGQMKELNTSVMNATIENQSLKATIADTQTSMQGLVEIAAKSVNNMRIALGGSALDMSAMSAVAILAEHANFSAQFTDKFKAGGVAAVGTTQAEKVAPQEDALLAARLQTAVPPTAKSK